MVSWFPFLQFLLFKQYLLPISKWKIGPLDDYFKSKLEHFLHFFPCFTVFSVLSNLTTLFYHLMYLFMCLKGLCKRAVLFQYGNQPVHSCNVSHNIITAPGVLLSSLFAPPWVGFGIFVRATVSLRGLDE